MTRKKQSAVLNNKQHRYVIIKVNYQHHHLKARTAIISFPLQI